MKNFLVLSVSLMILTAGCSIPGMGPYASDQVDRFIGTKFTNAAKPSFNPQARIFYTTNGNGDPWIYRTELEGAGTRYYISFAYSRCKYSLMVDENDIIRSWRDEGGRSSMKRCLIR